MRELFEKIGEYRKLWKLQEQEWLRDEDSVGEQGDDEEGYMNADSPDNPPVEGPHPSPTSVVTEPTPLSTPKSGHELDIIDQQLAELGVGGGTMTPKQRAELASLLAGIEEMKIESNTKTF